MLFRSPWSVHFAYNVVLGMSLCTYVLVGFYSIIFAYRRLARPGVSVEMRMLFLKKHAIYVIVLIFIWITSLISNYLDSLSLGPSYKGNDDYNQLNYLSDIETLSRASLFSTGVILMGIRTTDPFYRFLILSSIKEWYGIIDEEPEKGINAEVLSTFLSSSLNIELVYIILAGITKFSSEGGSDQK